MKYPKITALLGLTSMNIHSGLFGAAPHARFDEECLKKLEDHLSEKASGDIEQKLDKLQESYNTLAAENSSLQNAATQALELNGLTLSENATTIDALVLLGNKCKEYGASDNRHSFPKNDGKEKEDGLIEGYIDPNAEHNQIIAKVFNR